MAQKKATRTEPRAASSKTTPKAAEKKAPAAAKKGLGAAKVNPRTSSAKSSSPRAKPSAEKTSAPKARKLGKATPESVLETYGELRKMHPDAHCELVHENPFELIVATVLSAQTTDVAVNKATPGLFAKFPSAEKLARATPEEVEPLINTIGMFRQKAKNIIGLAKNVVERHGGAIPRTQAELVELPGVGRKTANVVLGVAFKTPEGVVVDTHVQRISQRLGWTENTTPETIEADLMRLLPKSEWDLASHTLIFHGRRVCSAARPACASCLVTARCPSAFDAENVGRKPPRVRA